MRFFIIATLAFLSVVTAIIVPRDSPGVIEARNHELENRNDQTPGDERRIVKPVKCETFAPVDCSPFGEGWYFDYYKCECVPPLPRACTNTAAITACRQKGSAYQLDQSCKCLPIHLPTHGPVPGPIPIPSSPITPVAA
jgi:hypothetical protein